MKFHLDGSLPEQDTKAGMTMNLLFPTIHRKGNPILVFGSNTAGRHGAGMAKVAHDQFGAVYGVGEGMTGDCYAIPTKTEGPRIIKGKKELVVLPLDSIKSKVERFLTYASTHPQLNFFVTRIGCGLSGYKDEEIAPFFQDPPFNCSFAEDWRPFLETPSASPRKPGKS